MKKISTKKAQQLLLSKYNDAKDLLADDSKTEKFLQDLEKKLRVIPRIGDLLGDVPLLISLVRHYIKKDYTKLPLGSLISIMAALIYVFSPFDFIPDLIPGIGYLDDAAVIALAVKLVGEDLEDYRKWRIENNIIFTD